jgi:lysylphosphatidylglycerol synthetase-like protein (DUF2156 family)
MSWKFTNWYTTHTKRRDKWDRIALIVVVAGLLLSLGRYPLYIKLAVGTPCCFALWMALPTPKNAKNAAIVNAMSRPAISKIACRPHGPHHE